MHILYLPSWYPLHENDLNGCFFREQAHAFVDSGHKVGVVAPQFRSLRLGKQAIMNRYGLEIWHDQAVTTYLGHNVFWFPKVPYLDLNRWVAVGMELFEQYIKAEGMPDILHVQCMLLAGPLALKIHEKYNIPYCIMEHSSTFARGLVKEWQVSYSTKAIEKSSYNMAVSDELANLLTSKFTGSEWHYFPNLLDKSFEQPLDAKLPINEKQFCAVAWLKPIKGFDVLLNAFAKVLEKYPDYQLVIAGDGPENKNLRSLADTLDISHSVIFSGALNREQVKTLMAQSFCYVLSSHVETFGVVVIEALSQGTPVIATKCGGPESILTPSDGILIPVNDSAAMADAMVKMIESDKQYDRTAIREHCLARFSETTFVAKMLAVYESCRVGSISA